MLDHKTQAAFLKALIAYEDNEESRQLRDSLAKADRERKRIRHALFLMVALFILSLAGLSYCALLLPQDLFQSRALRHHELERLGFGVANCPA